MTSEPGEVRRNSVAVSRTAGLGRLDVVQVLRFLAALLVVVAHSESRLARVFPDLADTTLVFDVGDLRRWGHLGVDLFFAISGFIMFWVSRKHFGEAGASRRFLVKRIIRIVPIYWLLTAFAVSLLAVAPGLFSYRGSCDPSWITASFLFVPWRAPEGFVSPVLGLGWTLNYEMYFYLWFAVLLLLPQRRAMRTITLSFLACALLGTFVDLRVPLLRQGTSWLLVEFLLGLWVGSLFASGWVGLARLGRVVGPLGVAVLLGTMFFNPTPLVEHETSNNFLRFLLWGAPSAAVLLWSLSSGWTPRGTVGGRAIVALGDASYSIYLMQVFSLPALGIAFRAAKLQQLIPYDGLVLLMTCCSVAAGYAFYAFVEQPLTRALQRRFDSIGTRPT